MKRVGNTLSFDLNDWMVVSDQEQKDLCLLVRREPRPERWECVNGLGAIVYDGLRQNEATLIASQHGLTAKRSA